MYICIRKEAIKQPKKTLNKMKKETLQITVFFTVVAILTIAIHFLSSPIYR